MKRFVPPEKKDPVCGCVERHITVSFAAGRLPLTLEEATNSSASFMTSQMLNALPASEFAIASVVPMSTAPDPGEFTAAELTE